MRREGVEETGMWLENRKQGKSWSGDACLAGRCLILDLLLGPQKLIEGVFIIKI